MRKTILIFACCLLGWGASSFAQSGTVSAGGTATGTGGSVTYTIGETNYINTTGFGGTITQGLQQPFEIYLPDGIEENSLQTEIGLYPNPTNEYVILSVTDADAIDLRYQLYDVLGSLLLDKEIVGTETSIYMENYATATYFLKVLNSKNESKEFKIIKN
ncbi:MAG: T9SS type A sorting domain-containing protein [Bacteroidota bacterium]